MFSILCIKEGNYMLNQYALKRKYNRSKLRWVKQNYITGTKVKRRFFACKYRSLFDYGKTNFTIVFIGTKNLTKFGDMHHFQRIDAKILPLTNCASIFHGFSNSQHLSFHLYIKQSNVHISGMKFGR